MVLHKSKTESEGLHDLSFPQRHKSRSISKVANKSQDISKRDLFSTLLSLVREVKGAPVLKILDLSSSNLNDEALYQVEFKTEKSSCSNRLETKGMGTSQLGYGDAGVFLGHPALRY